MADKITFKMMETSLNCMDKEVRDWFEDLVYNKIKVEIKKNGDHYVSISQHEFITSVENISDRYNQKYGVDLIADENFWYLSQRYPHEVVINNCAGESQARNFYMTVLEKFLDYLMYLSSEGCALW